VSGPRHLLIGTFRASFGLFTVLFIPLLCTDHIHTHITSMQAFTRRLDITSSQ